MVLILNIPVITIITIITITQRKVRRREKREHRIEAESPITVDIKYIQVGNGIYYLYILKVEINDAFRRFLTVVHY